jgi:hypothetical protein
MADGIVTLSTPEDGVGSSSISLAWVWTGLDPRPDKIASLPGTSGSATGASTQHTGSRTVTRTIARGLGSLGRDRDARRATADLFGRGTVTTRIKTGRRRELGRDSRNLPRRVQRQRFMRVNIPKRWKEIGGRLIHRH